METIVTRTKQKIRSVKDKWKEVYMRHRYVSGITVIELVLILVIVILGGIGLQALYLGRRQGR